MVDKKMIVFAPHPDDETLACGGTIIRKIREGYDVYVVVMTDGRHSHDHVLGLKEPPPEAIAKIRAVELAEATAVLGVPPDNLILLGFEDSKLKQCVTEARERTVQILRNIHPAEVYVAYRDDNNEDHHATYEIVATSIREADLATKVHEYPVWNEKIPRPRLKVLVVDIHQELNRKMEAVSKYRTQISKCFPNQEKTVLSEEFVRIFSTDTETFYTEQ
jgi:LmbE family N-acetylglucosaminyl deacetylase